MVINNKAELNLFEKAIQHCRNAVLLLTPEGKQYELKKPSDYIKGLAELMMQRKDHQESEIYTNCIDDEMSIFEFIQGCRTLLVT